MSNTINHFPVHVGGVLFGQQNFIVMKLQISLD